MKKFILLLFLALPFVSKAQDATWLPIDGEPNLWILDSYEVEINPAGYTFYFRDEDLSRIKSFWYVSNQLSDYQKNAIAFKIIVVRVNESFEKYCIVGSGLYDKNGNAIDEVFLDNITKRDFEKLKEGTRAYDYASYGYQLLNIGR